MDRIRRRLPAALAFTVALQMAADWKPAGGPLTTPWTASVAPDRVWPEYPRPQLVRKDWTSLNGLWEYAIRPKGDSRPAKFDGRILVPFAVESALSGVRRTLTADQRLWYRRTFNAPELLGKQLLLHFDAVDWRTEVFANGKAVGKHDGGYDAFSFDITDALTAKGPQELVVVVWDPTDTDLQPRGKQTLEPNAIWYTAVSGIWQTVWLELVPSTHITSLEMIPDVDAGKLRLTAWATGSAGFTATAKRSGRSVGRVSGVTNLPVDLALQQPDLWSPQRPALYDLEVTLSSGDAVQSYFGMRKIVVRKDAAGINRLFLNNQPLFQIGPLDQGWWPDGLYTAPTDEALRYDIEVMKKLGYNMCRKHIKVEPARWYYWCDKLGFLVWQDMPSAKMRAPIPKDVKRDNLGDPLLFSPEQDANFRRELETMIKTHISVPSIVAWVTFNETWGQHATLDILKQVKALDPSRLTDGPSGWADRGYGDMRDMHKYPGPDMHPVMPDRASVLGEFGGLGLPVEGHLWFTLKENLWWNKRDAGQRALDSPAKLQAAYEELIGKLRPLVKAGLSAAVYTQTTDVEGEINGLMTYDRKVIKYDAAKLSKLHQQLIDQ